MSKAIIDEQSLTDIADAIRAKNGSADTYTPSEMATAITDLPTPTPVTKGLVFSDYDSDGYPTKAEFVGFVGSLPTNYGRAMFLTGRFGQKITQLTIPSEITTLANINENTALTKIVLHSGITVAGADAVYGCKNLTDCNIEDTSIQNFGAGCFYQTKIPIIKFPATTTRIRDTAFSQCTSTTEIHFLGDVVNIENNVFRGDTAVTLYDFSNHTSNTIPSLYSTDSLGHANGCVIKVPQSLLSTWQTTAVWQDLTGVVWQGV